MADGGLLAVGGARLLALAAKAHSVPLCVRALADAARARLTAAPARGARRAAGDGQRGRRDPKSRRSW